MKLRPEFEALALKIQEAVDRARTLYPWPIPEPFETPLSWAADLPPRIKALESRFFLMRQVAACAGEAGELCQAVTKDQGDERINEEAIDVLATAARVYFRQ